MKTGEAVLYNEVQRFRQPWMLALLGLMFALAAWGFIQQIVLGVPWGNNPAPDWVLVVSALFTGVLLPGFMLSINLHVQVRDDGVHVRFWPLHLRWVRIPSESIQEWEAVQYSPLRNYGGWGIRWGMREGSWGKAYNVSGRSGVALTLDGGRHLLIGSRRPDELARAIDRIKADAAGPRPERD